jgi:hypothetical protein
VSRIRAGYAWAILVLLMPAAIGAFKIRLPVIKRAPWKTYYVATIGSDFNPGTQALPWRTIQKAANTMVAGDTCVVLPGSYGERVQVTRSGNSGTPITYRAEGTVVMKGFTLAANYITVAGFDITDTDNMNTDGYGIAIKGSYCTIENNYIHYCTRGGINMWVEPGDSAAISGCIIRNNRLYRNAMAGIEVYGRNHLVEGNEIWGTIQYHPKWTNPPSWVDADGIRFFGTGHIIRGNYIHDISYRDPENVSPHIDCFQSWGPAYNITFEQNVCMNCENLPNQIQTMAGHGFMVEGGTGPVHDLIIRNNVIRAFRSNFIGCQNVKFLNNTFTSLIHSTLGGHSAIVLSNSPDATIQNNIFYDVSDRELHINADAASRQTLLAGYNCVYRSDGQSAVGSPDPNDLWNRNPLFANPATDDFHLQAKSPCIDSGFALTGVTSDFDGVSRPQGAGYDIGAFEYRGKAPVPW